MRGGSEFQSEMTKGTKENCVGEGREKGITMFDGWEWRVGM